MKMLMLTLVGFFYTSHLLVRADDIPRHREIVFVGVWDRALPLLDHASRTLTASIRTASVKEFMEHPELFQNAGAVLILNLDPSEVPRFTETLKRLKGSHPATPVLSLDQRDTQTPLIKAGLLTTDPKLAGYWKPSGLENIRRLLQYVKVRHLGESGAIEPPLPIPESGYYEPKRSEPFADYTSLKAFRIAAGKWWEGRPSAVLLIHHSFWIVNDTKVIDAQVDSLLRRKINCVVVFGDTHTKVADLITAAHPDIIIEDRHGGSWPKNTLESIDVPYLRPISFLGTSVDEWRASPRGMAPRDVSSFMTLQEVKGTIEPVVVGGLRANVQGFRVHEPIPDRIEKFAARTTKWLELRAKKNAEKRIAIVYYNKSLGKDDLLRGSPTGAFLDGPESLIRFLPRLAQSGYRVENCPQSASQLLERVKAQGRNIGPWAQAELDEQVAKGVLELVPLENYEKWFQAKLSESCRKAVLDRHGPAPGKLMVTRVNGKPYIAIPGLRLGNVYLGPQPERGERQDDRLLHSRDVPPPHNYLAYYWWLEEEFKADAVVHWGTHGTVELLPGKEAGLSSDCWGDICVGAMPIVNLWIMDNLGEATLSRRRSYAELVDHMVPALVNAGLTDELRSLHDDIDKYDGLEAGVLKEEFRKKITLGAKSTGVAETLKISCESSLQDEAITRVATYLHDVYESTTPVRLHILGTPPPKSELPSYLVSILRQSFLDHLAEDHPVPREEDRFPGDKYKWLRAEAESLLRLHLFEHREPNYPLNAALQHDLATAKQILARLEAADAEIQGLLRALDGRYIQPGSGPDPIRNPGCLPGGRNLYSLNPEEIPSRPSWDTAVKLMEELLRTKRPSKVAFDLNGMDTMRDYGVAESQILFLLGVRPVWDTNQLAIDVELIPRDELKRPRVDVFVAMGGMYKENFPTRVKLLDKAIRLAASSPEQDNGVAAGSRVLEKRLLDKGFSSDKAKSFAYSRIFGCKPGNMSGTGILHLAPRSGVWDKTDEIADVYIDHMSYVYVGDLWGEKIEGLYGEAIQGTDLMMRVWASNMTSPLSNHHVYEYLGGMSMAVKKMTGRNAEAMIADVRSPDRARVRNLEETLATCFRAELLNRKWIQGMRSHGYAGAGHMAELVKNSYGWSITRPDSITQQLWNDVHEIYIQDKLQMGITDFFEKENPHARQEILATLLEADRTGVWTIDVTTRRELAKRYAVSVALNGDNAGLVSGGNIKLERHVVAALKSSPNPEDLATTEKYREALSRSSGVFASQRETAAARDIAELAKQASETQKVLVTGAEINAQNESTSSPVSESRERWWIIVAIIFFVAVVTAGALSRRGGV